MDRIDLQIWATWDLNTDENNELCPAETASVACLAMLVFQGKPTLLPCASKRWPFESFQAPQLPGWFFWPGLLPSEEMPGHVPTSALHQLPGYFPFLNYGPSLLVLLHIPFCIAAEQLRVSLFSPISWEGRNVLLEYLRNNSLPLDSIWAEIWNIKSKKKKKKKKLRYGRYFDF